MQTAQQLTAPFLFLRAYSLDSSMAGDESIRRLQRLLVKEANVDPTLAEHAISTLGLASVADLAKFWVCLLYTSDAADE